MNVLTICPCCSTPLLHHLSNHREYWFCRHCWQEMPDLEMAKQKHQRSSKIISLSTGFPRCDRSCWATPNRALSIG